MTFAALELSENPTKALWGIPLAYLEFTGLALKNAESFLRCAQELISARSGAELCDAIRDEFDLLSEEVEELSAIGAAESEDVRLTFWD